MSLRYFNSEMTMEERSSRNGSRDRLGLSFTIDYLLFNKGAKASKDDATASRAAEQITNDMPGRQNPKLEEVGIRCEIQEKGLQRSEVDAEKRKAKEDEGDEDQKEEGEEEVTTTTTTTSASCGTEKSADKPNQSYIALISKAILASEQKKLLLCDIYQWIMDHYPYFKSKDKNWRNSVRHNLSLNDCFIKAGRSDNGKGHYWAIHPSNYQDFSNGDYHCRRARRRVRRVPGQLPLSSLSSPYYPAIVRPHRTTCWCCPQASALPLQCLAPRLYWPWSSMQPQIGLHLGLNASVP
ncbi:forkhead box Q2 [Neolamprologus brichardi]|uniref:forkhead box Q2 n=1 Tax=Neolamprologus brichardi TaxID=32507 RepID=UPI001643A340|nr:forkhead box Q2 [Neolamprologus brichardi]